ncbi:MAG TPA: DUF1360 domain-containing protein [Longimicrobium sp.]|nr:DUF1360 domain-containing protein [Longimicrobium sp.]
MDPWMRLALAVLATWRVTHLLGREDGPGEVLARLRARLGWGFWGRLMDCFYCLSVWVAAPLAFFVARRPAELLVAWLALSGAACLLERLGAAPVAFTPLSNDEQER